MIICPKCKNEVNEDDYCSKCGFKLNNTTLIENRQFCPSCGFENHTRDNFCKKCGASFNSSSHNMNFNKPILYPIILGIISIAILLIILSKILFILCLLAFGFLFGFKSDRWFINSILVGVIPAIFFIILIPGIFYVLMSFVSPVIGGYMGYYLKEKKHV